MKRATRNRILTIFILLIFVVSGLIAVSPIQSGPTTTNWMAQIVIQINDEQQYPIPADIGVINNQTVEKVYTTSTNGVVYKNTTGSVTMKDFFDEWNQTFNSTCILGYCNTNTSFVTMFVNGKINDQFDYYTIQNKDIIIIVYR